MKLRKKIKRKNNHMITRKIKKFLYKNLGIVFKEEGVVDTIRDIAVDNLYRMVRDYSEWYDEHGLYLPPDYASDPTGWTIALQKMRRSFGLLYEEMNGYGELWEAKNVWKEYGAIDIEKINELNKEIKEGLSLFGSQLIYMTDPKKGTEKGK
jgi:hypothetical protein